MTQKIIQFSAKTGKFIKKWDSIVQASKGTSTNERNISSVLRKKTKTANGCVWMYNEEYEKRIAIFK